jgi:hypothetical protein
MLFAEFISNCDNASVMPMPKRGCMARVLDGQDEQTGWKVVYDYRDGLPKVEGALWEILLEDGNWKWKSVDTESDEEDFW